MMMIDRQMIAWIYKQEFVQFDGIMNEGQITPLE